jgi:hypothetical protein
MKQHPLLIILSALLSGSAVTASAQDSDFETWRRQKTQEYTRWQELRAETGHLPASKRQQAIGSFIDRGFGHAPAGVTRPGNPSNSSNSSNPSNPGSPPAAVPSDMRVWVVVVGVAAYRHIPGLNYTDDDGYRMYAFYKSPEGGSLPDGQIRVLIDEDATRSNVMQAMNGVYSGATERDAIVFYFSGHGTRSAFLMQEYNGAQADRRGILMHQEIQAIFDRSPARYKYVLADACHSGAWAQQAAGGDAEGAYYRAFERAGGGTVLLLSSMGDEYSIESSGVRQGVFSHYLIRGLKGEADANNDRTVSIIELFDFVETRVSESTNRRQTPVLSGDYQSNPPVSPVRAAAPPVF